MSRRTEIRSLFTLGTPKPNGSTATPYNTPPHIHTSYTPYLIVMPYLFLAISILLEAIGTICIQLSDGFTKAVPIALTCVCYVACFYFLSLALKGIPLGIAYAIWAGVGVVLSNVAGVVFFKQQANLPMLIGIALIVAGVVILNLFSSSSTH